MAYQGLRNTAVPKLTRAEKIARIFKSCPDLQDTVPDGKNNAFLVKYGYMTCGVGDMWCWFKKEKKYHDWVKPQYVEDAPDNILDGILKRVS